MEERTIIFYGQSMLLSLLAASFKPDHHLNLIRAVSWEEVDVVTANGSPDVLFYDLTSAGDCQILRLFYQNPQLLLVGLDVETNRAFILTNHYTGSMNLERVKEIVQGSRLNIPSLQNPFPD